MTSLLAALIISIIPQDSGVLVDYCDLVELNHLYNEHGQPVFDQLIWYDWSWKTERHEVVAWRLVKDYGPFIHSHWMAKTGDGSGQWPAKATSRYVCEWIDGEIPRRVTARSYRETWSQFDPELVEREYLPKEQRRELKKPRKE